MHGQQALAADEISSRTTYSCCCWSTAIIMIMLAG
jgi:hypothetical protein